jgi:hypothetical protein
MHPDVRLDLALSLFPARIIFPAAHSDDSIPLAAESLFGNLTEWDCTNEDHCPVICFRVGRMHRQPAELRNEANCRPSMRRAHGRCVRRYGDGGHDDLSHRRGLRCLGPIADHRRRDVPNER